MNVEVDANFVEKVRAWVTSEEGRKAIEDGVKQSAKMSQELREAQRIKDWSILHRPVTI